MGRLRKEINTTGRTLCRTILTGVFLLCVCVTPAAAADGGHYFIYYLNYEETALESKPYIPSDESGEFMLQDLMIRLNERERSTQGASLLPGEVQINSFAIEGQTLNLEFNEAYLQMDAGRELLTRAGIVRTFLQVPQITGVRIQIGRDELTDHRGNPVGVMNLSDFVDISGSDSDPYRYDSFSLYFTDKKGKRLLEERRNVYYRRSIPREKVILEQLAKGPMEKEHYPTIPENTVVNSVRVFDRVCYVDFGSTFLDYVLPIREKTIAASVANSLIAGGSVDEVQIRVEGDDHAQLGDLPLYRFFSWNEELIPVEED